MTENKIYALDYYFDSELFYYEKSQLQILESIARIIYFNTDFVNPKSCTSFNEFYSHFMAYNNCMSDKCIDAMIEVYWQELRDYYLEEAYDKYLMSAEE